MSKDEADYTRLLNEFKIYADNKIKEAIQEILRENYTWDTEFHNLYALMQISILLENEGYGKRK